MAFGRNKERPDRDEFGEKDLPFVTSEKAMEFNGIKPLRGASEKSVNFRRKSIAALLIATMAFFTVSSGTALVSNSRTANLKTQVEQNMSPAFKSRYDSLGESVVRAYFGQQTPPVNLMSNVSWPTMNDSGGNSTPVNVESISLLNAYQTDFYGGEISKEDKKLFVKPKNEVLRYVGVIDGRQYEFGVYLIIPDIDNPRQLPYLVSPPTILPMDRLVTADVEGSKPTGEEFSETKLNEGTLNNITRWASAYAQNDSDTLKSLTGDNRVEAIYPGVGGFSLEGNPEVIWAYQYEDPETTEQRIVARIQFSMSSPVSGNSSNKDISGSSSGGKFAPLQVMDLLLGNFDEGEADILAWGPGGMWQTLQPRMNAVLPVVTSGTGDGEGQINPTPTGETDDGGQAVAPGAPTLTDNSTVTSTLIPEDGEDETGSSAESSANSSGSTSSSSARSSSSSSKPKSSRSTSTSSKKSTENKGK